MYKYEATGVGKIRDIADRDMHVYGRVGYSCAARVQRVNKCRCSCGCGLLMLPTVACRRDELRPVRELSQSRTVRVSTPCGAKVQSWGVLARLLPNRHLLLPSRLDLRANAQHITCMLKWSDLRRGSI